MAIVPQRFVLVVFSFGLHGHPVVLAPQVHEAGGHPQRAQGQVVWGFPPVALGSFFSRATHTTHRLDLVALKPLAARLAGGDGIVKADGAEALGRPGLVDDADELGRLMDAAVLEVLRRELGLAQGEQLTDHHPGAQRSPQRIEPMIPCAFAVPLVSLGRCLSPSGHVSCGLYPLSAKTISNAASSIPIRPAGAPRINEHP